MQRGFDLAMEKFVLLVSVSAALFAGACADDSAGRAPAHSQTIVASSSGRTAYVVAADDDSIVAYSLDDGTVERTEVGRDPSRVARVGDRVVVSVRGERKLAVLREGGEGHLVLEATIETGAEPVGVVAAPVENHVFVAASQSGTVAEIDLDTHEAVRGWTIKGEPRWLALHPSGRALYVASAYFGILTAIDLVTGEQTLINLPVVTSVRSDTLFAGAPLVFFALAPRLTGDPAVTVDGARLLVPGAYIDNQSAISEHTETSTVVNPFFSGYQHRVRGVVFSVPLTREGAPLNERIRAMPIDASFVSGPRGLGLDAPSSYPTSVTVAPGNDHYVTTFESSRGIVAAPVYTPNVELATGALTSSGGPAVLGGSFGSGNTLTLPGRRPGLESELVFPEGFAISTDAGPRGAAYFAGGILLVDTFLVRGIDPINSDDLSLMFTDSDDIGGAFRRLEAGALIVTGKRAIDPERDRGRRLFYTANDGRISARFSSISCSTCHFDGRNDGLTWNFSERGGRQTPSLAGEIKLTEPVGWEGAVPTVADEVLRTSRDRMGGAEITEDDALAIERFLNTSRDVDTVRKHAIDEAAMRGRTIFERSDVGCSGCHIGPRLTDNRLYPMFGLEAVKTRSLVGIAASAPYLHDGSLPTLRDIVDAAKGGGMGDTSTLTDLEVADLVAYLETL